MSNKVQPMALTVPGYPVEHDEFPDRISAFDQGIVYRKYALTFPTNRPASLDPAPDISHMFLTPKFEAYWWSLCFCKTIQDMSFPNCHILSPSNLQFLSSKQQTTRVL